MNKKYTPTPHDAIFKQFLEDPATARDFLEIWLPEDIKSLCQFSTLRTEPTSFVEENMKTRHSDILWSVKTTRNRGYIYCLVEHQSSPDKLIAWRLMRYSMAAMQRHLDAGHKTLPLVVPLLFYCGKTSPHPYSMNWLDSFEQPLIAEKLYSQPFKIADLTVTSDNDIMQHRRIALLELIQKHIRRRNMAELLTEIVRLLSYDYYTEKQVTTLMNYLIQEGNTPDPLHFVTEISKKAVKHERTLMNIAEGIKEKGREEGRQQGRQQGREEGREEERLEIVKKMIKKAIDRATIKQLTGLSDEEINRLMH